MEMSQRTIVFVSFRFFNFPPEVQKKTEQISDYLDRIMWENNAYIL